LLNSYFCPFFHRLSFFPCRERILQSLDLACGGCLNGLIEMY
jgi:hypothetical protein